MSITTSDSTSTTAATTGTNALSSISSNYNQFLTLLTTQLQNQDPSNPMDTSQFTSELAQFAGVQQQVSTNTNLTSLIQLAQSSQVLQGSSLLGRQVELDTTTLPLQGGHAHLDFTATGAEPVKIVVQDSSGNTVQTATVNAAAGSNGWDWNGQNAAGVTQPDGGYTVAVTTAAADGTASNLAFTTHGTVTGVTKDGSGIDLTLGTASTGMANVVKLDS